MSAKIDWAMNVQVAGGPKLLVSDTLTVDAYDMIDVTIPLGGSDTIVDIQPNVIANVAFLLIKAADKSVYRDSALTYKPDGTQTPIPLDAPLMLFGHAVAQLTSATKITFNNTSKDADAVVSILIGRNAIEK